MDRAITFAACPECGGRIVFEGRPADLARSTLTAEHLAAYVGT